MDITSRWKINPFVDLHWRTWNNETVLFDSASGDTHLLEPITVEVLKFIEASDSSQSITDVVKRITPITNEGEEDAFAHVQHVIAACQRLGIVVQEHI